MKPVVISLVLLVLGVIMTVTGNRLIQTACGDGIFPQKGQRKRWKLGRFLISTGILLFLGIFGVWAGYGRFYS